MGARGVRSSMRSQLLALTLLAGLLLPAAAAPPDADARLRVGIADQKASAFGHPLFKSLRVRRTRLIVAYNAALKRSERAQTDDWMRAARSRRLEIVVAFNHDTRDRCPARPCRAPSARSYSRAVRAFHRRYRRYGVRIYQPWNESNSRTQPTTGTRGARRVAGYYKTLVRMCRRRCTVTGADIQDIGDYVGYTRSFLRAVGRRKPRVMGFHNYSDTNRRGYGRTARFVRAMPRGTKVWLTETGGIFSFTQQNGTVSLRPSESRAARSISHMFRIARRYSRSIDRVYIYQWQKTNAHDRFDAGIVDPRGAPRRSYSIVRRYRKYLR